MLSAVLDEPKSEPGSREKIVGKQREIEEQLACDENGRAIFFVNFPLTPMYISPAAIEKDPESGLFIVKKNPEFKNAIPEGLIPEDKLEDPEQLSTVLGRVLSLWELKKNPIIIFYVEDRCVGDKEVDKTQLEMFQRRHDNFVLQKISKEEDYTPFIGKIAEATYAYRENDQQVKQCIFSAQIITPNRPSAWQILAGKDAQASIDYLNELLVKYGKDPINLGTKTNDERTHASIDALCNKNVFTPRPANEAANTSLLSEETCRPLSPSK